MAVRLSADQYQDFTYTNNGIATTITDYTGSGGAVTIPESIPPGSWTRVTSIGPNAFEMCGGLTRVTIPRSVTSIGFRAFAYCSGLTSVVFLGDAPTVVGPSVFDNSASEFTIYYFNGKAGFTSPLWNGYPAVNAGEPTPLKTWLLENGLPPDASLQDDPNHDGVNLLMAYALDLNPQLNLSGRMPRPMLAGNQLSITFHAGAAGVTYLVETSTDLETWSQTGVRISDPDANLFRTARVDMAGTSRFLRLVVSHTD